MQTHSPLENLFDPLRFSEPEYLWMNSPRESQGVEYAYRAEMTADGRGAYMSRYVIIKTTPKGFWIDEYGKHKLVRGRYAHRRKDDALRCLIWRRRKYVQILESKLRASRTFLKLVESSLNGIAAAAELHKTNSRNRVKVQPEKGSTVPIIISIHLEIVDAEDRAHIASILSSLGAALSEEAIRPVAQVSEPDNNVVQLKQPRGRPRKTEQEPAANPQDTLKAAVETVQAEAAPAEEKPVLTAATAVDDGKEIVPAQPQDLKIEAPAPAIQGEPPVDAAPQSASREEVAKREELTNLMRKCLAQNLAQSVQKTLGDFGAATNKQVKTADLDVVIAKLEELLSNG